MPLWGVGYFVLFGMPFLGKEASFNLSSFEFGMISEALGLTVLGAFCCLLAFYTPVSKWVETLTPALRQPWDLRRAPKSGVILCLLGIAAHYVLLTTNTATALAQPLSVFSKSATMGVLTLFLLQLRGKLSLRLKIFLWGFVLPVEYLFGLGTGSVYNAVIVMAPLLCCYCAERRKIPVLWTAIVLGVFIIPFLGFKGEYRSYAWSTEGDVQVSSSPFQRGLFFVQLVTTRLTEGGTESYSVAVETAEERASQLELLANVMEQTPGIVPFWKGETYASLFWVFVPRILYPNKPKKLFGNEFGHRYGILHEEDEITSVNIPHQVVEMYINFGRTGVFFGMLLVGCLYRAITTLLDRPESGERALIIGCTICSVLLNLESDFSLVFGGVIYCLLILYTVSSIFHGNAPAQKKEVSPA
ncbi:MAG: hypothetical protein Q7J69_02960 [Candidatus Omnitrophota bacterium]|nr:hypothetical protein [Candidatus Omnitrophota bacterium]